MIPFRQPGRQAERFTARRLAVILLALFRGEDPAKFALPLHRQRHLFTVRPDHDVWHRRGRHIGGGGMMHRVKQTPLGVGTNRLRLAVGIDVVWADTRR